MPEAGATILAYTDSGTYVPEIHASTNPDLGSGAEQEGWWYRNGLLITCGGHIQFGSSPSQGSGTYLITLPFRADLDLVVAGGSVAMSHIGGSAMLRDNGTLSNSRNAVAQLRGTGEHLWLRHEDGQGNNTVQPNNPWAWVQGDAIAWQFIYPADASEFIS